MNKHEREQKKRDDAVKARKEARADMIRFCSMDFRGKDHPAVPWNETKQAKFDARLAAMSLTELTKEYNRRDGDHVRDHGCMPEQLEELPED